jgi:hypothetical protein
MNGNPSHETTCPECNKPMKPVKGEIYYFCPECWCRLDIGDEVRCFRPYQKKAQADAAAKK